MAPQIPVHILQMQQRVGLYGTTLGLGHQPAICLSAEALVQGMHKLRFHSEAPCSGMTSKTGQQITAVGEGTIHSEPDGPAYGGPKASITVTGQKGGGTVVTLHQTRSNNANHAVVPVALCQKQKGGKGITGLRFDERNGFRFNRVAKIPSCLLYTSPSPRDDR